MFDWQTAWEILPLLLDGFATTIQATVIAFAVAMVLGLVWALLRFSHRRWLTAPVNGLVEFVRSTPLLVQLYFLYYVLPDWGLTASALVTGIAGLGLHYSAYLAEIYRGGINGVPRGQWEAATALGLSRPRIWADIVLPQAIPPILPAMGNRLIAMFKDSALLAVITVSEVLLVAKEVGDERFSYLEPYTIAGVLFLLVSLVASRLVDVLETRFGSDRGGP